MRADESFEAGDRNKRKTHGVHVRLVGSRFGHGRGYGLAHIGTDLRKCGEQSSSIADAGDPELNQILVGEISQNSIVHTFPEEVFKKVLAPFCFENGFKL
jgi:hypothetical protein